MLKHWDAWPRRIRWLVALAVVVLALAIAWALFVPVADWLARHDVGSAKGSLLQTARDAARGRLLTLGAGLLAAGALLFTARTFTLSREGQVTDRYTKAIEQLGSKELDVRIGGIYALERVARDSARDHPTVMEVLTAFIREHLHDQWPLPESGVAEPERPTRPDVQAAVTVIGRRDAKRDIQSIDLIRAVLRGAHLPGAYLDGAKLRDADLAGADLTDANLDGAYLDGADLTRAVLRGAHLPGAYLDGADLTRAVLRGAHLPGAYLDGANLTRADLTRAVLVGAHLTRADLTDANLDGAYLEVADLARAVLRGAYLAGANLAGANLTRADLARAVLRGAYLAGADLAGADLAGANLEVADLTGARWPKDAPVPQGWKLDTSSGRLEAASTDSGPAEAN